MGEKKFRKLRDRLVAAYHIIDSRSNGDKIGKLVDSLELPVRRITSFNNDEGQFTVSVVNRRAKTKLFLRNELVITTFTLQKNGSWKQSSTTVINKHLLPVIMMEKEPAYNQPFC
jgi:hypothetical protein